MGRAVDRRAGLGDRAAGQLRHDGEALHVRGLALVGRHAERGVALQVLDGLEAFERSQRRIGRRHVVLEIDEGFFLPFTCQSGFSAKAASSLGGRRIAGAVTEAKIGRGRCAAAWPSLEAVGEREARRWRSPPRPCRRGAPSGTKAAMSSRHFGRPRCCEVSPTAGFQPPETASPSACKRGARAAGQRHLDLADSLPAAVDMVDHAVQHRKTVLGRQRALRRPRPPRVHRRRPAIVSPAASAASTVFQPSSLLVKSASRFAGVAT